MRTSNWESVPWSTLSCLVMLFGLYVNSNAQEAAAGMLVDSAQHCLAVTDADRVACGPAWINYLHCKARGCCFDQKGSLTRCYYGKTPGQFSAAVRSVLPVVLPCGATVAPPVVLPCGATVAPPVVLPCGATVAPPVVLPCGATVAPPVVLPCGATVAPPVVPPCGATVAPPVPPCFATPAPLVPPCLAPVYPPCSPCSAVGGCIQGSSWGSGEETNSSNEKDSKKDGKKCSNGNGGSSNEG